MVLGPPKSKNGSVCNNVRQGYVGFGTRRLDWAWKGTDEDQAVESLKWPGTIQTASILQSCIEGAKVSMGQLSRQMFEFDVLTTTWMWSTYTSI